MRRRFLNDFLNIKTDKYVVLENGDVISFKNPLRPIKLKATILDRGKGYAYVSISENGRPRKFYVHQIVALAFIPNPSGHKEVNHIDCNTLNNHASNLEWVSHSENIKHAWDNGMMSHRIMNPRRGEDAPSAVLNADRVLEIRNAYSNRNNSYRRLAKEYGVSSSCIQSIIERKTWSHL